MIKYKNYLEVLKSDRSAAEVVAKLINFPKHENDSTPFSRLGCEIARVEPGESVNDALRSMSIDLEDTGSFLDVEAEIVGDLAYIAITHSDNSGGKILFMDKAGWFDIKDSLRASEEEDPEPFCETDEEPEEEDSEYWEEDDDVQASEDRFL